MSTRANINVICHPINGGPLWEDEFHVNRDGFSDEILSTVKDIMDEVVRDLGLTHKELSKYIRMGLSDDLMNGWMYKEHHPYPETLFQVTISNSFSVEIVEL